MRFSRLLPGLLLCFLAGAALAQGQRRGDICAGAAESRKIEGVTRDGEIVLAGGARHRLAQIRLPDEPALMAKITERLERFVGREVTIRSTGPADRWSRTPSFIAAGSDDSLARLLLAEGLAAVDGEGQEALCERGWLRLEAEARGQGLGLWSIDRYKAVPASEMGRLGERIGRFTLVEGRVRSVGVRRQRTYLNFGTDWSSDFTVDIPARIWSRMEADGLDAAALRGRLVRIRGVLEERQGPTLTVLTPELVEILDARRR